jgi:flagellar biosynthesis protein FlhF
MQIVFRKAEAGWWPAEHFVEGELRPRARKVARKHFFTGSEQRDVDTRNSRSFRMTERTFRAPTMREALIKVQRELGASAMVVSTRSRRDARSGVVVEYEILARAGDGRAAEGGRVSSVAPASAVGRLATQRTPQRSQTAPRGDAPPLAVPQARSGAAPSEDVRVILEELASLRQSLRALHDTAQALEKGASDWTELRRDVERIAAELLPAGEEGRSDDPEVRKLMSRGVDPAIARAIAYRARGRVAPGSGLTVAKSPDLEQEVALAIPTAAPLWAREDRVVAALVGPAGAGKTATLAKLAWNAIREGGKRVGVVATDGHRAGRADALRQIAERLRIPLHLARSRHELSASLAQLGDRDVVLVDTPGHCPWNDQALFALDALLSDIHVERHLVVPATWRSTELAELIRRYVRFGLASLILTKADEARDASAVLAATWESRIPLSSLCSGQRVPDDISAANSRELARRLLLYAA